MEQGNMIMIVDDNPIDQMITTHIVKMVFANREIVVMQSAMAALEYLHHNQHDPKFIPSLILLDLDMPGMNGFGFLAQFSAFGEAVKKACKIVVLTASKVASDIKLMQADPHVAQLIAKPLSKNALVPVI